MDTGHRLSQREVNEHLAGRVPHHAWESVVSIVVADRPNAYQLGTGILFAVADIHFVITAAHVIRIAQGKDKTIGISNGRGSFYVPDKDWYVTCPFQYGSVVDPFDIAIYQLPPDKLEQFSGKKFLRLSDVDFDEPSATAVYSLFGYPGIWAAPGSMDDPTVSLKALEFTTYAFDEDVSDLTNYKPEFHLLMGATFGECTDIDASPMSFRRRDGREARFPGDLGGISGCCVWRIGDLRIPLKEWRQQPLMVAVQTSVYPNKAVIQATRWVGVTTLIHEAFPELRPALRVHASRQA
jgi:hypothetical protein